MKSAHTVKQGVFMESLTGLRTFNKRTLIELENGQEEYDLNNKLLLERRQLIGLFVQPPNAAYDINVSHTQKLASREVFDSAILEIYEGETKVYEIPLSEVERVQQFNDYYPLNMGQLNLDRTKLKVWNRDSIDNAAKTVISIFPVYVRLKK